MAGALPEVSRGAEPRKVGRPGIGIEPRVLERQGQGLDAVAVTSPAFSQVIDAEMLAWLGLPCGTEYGLDIAASADPEGVGADESTMTTRSVVAFMVSHT